MPSSALEVYPSLYSAGPGPGIPLTFEVAAGHIFQIPAAYYGVGGQFDEAIWTNLALQYLVAKYGGGTVHMVPGPYSTLTQITVPPFCVVDGAGATTVINPSGVSPFSAMYMHDTVVPFSGSSYSAIFALHGRIENLVIDGTNAAAGSVGLDIGDGLGYEVNNVWVRNFSGANSIGFHFNNLFTWSEKIRARHLTSSNNTTAAVWEQIGTGPNATNSFAYNQYDIDVYIGDAQNGLVFQGGANMSGCEIHVHGNIKQASTAGILITITGQQPGGGAFSKLQDSQIALRVENNQAGINPTTISFGAASNVVVNCFGGLFFIGNAWTPSNVSVANQFGFTGPIVLPNTGNPTDPGLQGLGPTPAVPGSGNTLLNNTGKDVMIQLTGGTISAITVGGVSITSTTNPILLRAGVKIVITYTVAPTWVWY